MGDVELVAVLLGMELTRAARLIADAGGIGGVSRASQSGLVASGVIGPTRARRLEAAIELGRRVNLALLSEHRPIMDGRLAVEAWARPRLGWLDHEELWVLCLDGRSALRGASRIAQGGMHGCATSARDILRTVIAHVAAGYILVHNHPSGDPRPSLDDLEMTRHLHLASEVVGVKLVDHVVVSRSGSSSLLELGVFGE